MSQSVFVIGLGNMGAALARLDGCFAHCAVSYCDSLTPSGISLLLAMEEPWPRSSQD